MTRRPVTIETSQVTLAGDLVVPDDAHGLVVFAHGSGSSRQSPRNRQVAAVLEQAGLATLLFDLLTPEEESIDRVTAELRFDIALLARRLIETVDWVAREPQIGDLPIGLFGASTGAAAALAAAAARRAMVHAVVSRGGRPDLAEPVLRKVRAPVLLIVGGADEQVLALNRQAAEQLHDVRVEVVSGATHLFEEPGTLGEVARLARDFFVEHLAVDAAEMLAVGSAGPSAIALPFQDRRRAGALLAHALTKYAHRHDVIVLGLPRGGVPVADEVAHALDAPLDVVVVRKLGAPGMEELAMGAVGPGGVRVLNPEVTRYFTTADVEEETARELGEVARRERLFRGARPPLDVRGKVVILVDDGLATGATMRAGVAWARAAGAARVVVAVPVASPEAVALVGREAHEVVCLATPEDFAAVGMWYRDFRPISEAEVASVLGGAWTPSPAPP
jgi:predicted phosphoribosyltransferase/dienelactone hydrolase